MTPNTGFVLWFTGLSGAGKSTTAEALMEVIEDRGFHRFEHVDGDDVREVLCKDLGFSAEDRRTNLERVGYLSGLLSKHDVGVISTFVSPYEVDRQMIRKKVTNYIEVFVDTPLEVCEQRDVKWLYAKAREGIIKNFTGISDPYERPENPEIHLTTDIPVEENVEKIIKYLKENDYIS